MDEAQLTPKQSRGVNGFVDFVREQGVVGLAVGFLLGGSISQFVTAFVTDIVNPIIGAFIGLDGLKTATFQIGSAQFRWGDFAADFIDFVIIAAVVYFGVKGLGLDRIDRQPAPPAPPPLRQI